MIIVLVKYKCKDGMREKFLEAIKYNNIDILSQNESGNIRYEYSYSIVDENELILTEVWKDEDSIKQHAGQVHFKLLGELKKEYVNETEINRYKGERYE